MLNRLQPRPGARRPHKRVGRGSGGAGHKTAGRGTKGQGHRSAGGARPARFEGGQMPLVRRLPKRGFHSRGRTTFQEVNVAALTAFEDGSTVDFEALIGRGLVRPKGGPVKLLGQGDAPKNLTVKVHRASAGAVGKIEQAGGKVEFLE
jgi:large subunit ribosomal protein L15